MKITKEIEIESDLETFVIPAIGSIAGMLHFSESDEKSKEIIEATSTILFNICNSLKKHFENSPTLIGEIRQYTDKLCSDELLSNLLKIISMGVKTQNYAGLSQKTMQNFLISLQIMCIFSPLICKKCVSNIVFITLLTILSTSKIEDNTNLQESIILLINAILPMQHLISPKRKVKTCDKEYYDIETEKAKTIEEFVEKLCDFSFSKTVLVFEETRAANIKFACVQVIEKLLNLCQNTEKVIKLFSPQIASKFIKENLSSEEILCNCFGLECAEIMFKKLCPIQSLYFSQAMREGIFDLIQKGISNTRPNYRNPIEKSLQPIDYFYIKYFESYSKQKKQDKEKSLTAKRPRRSRQYGMHDITQSKINEYLEVKSKEIANTYIFDKEMLNKCVTLFEANNANNECSLLVQQLTLNLQKGINGGYEEWENIFQKIASLLSSENSITDYEAHHSGLLERLYEVLCILPSKYNETIRREELKESQIVNPHSDFQELAIRHSAFMKVFFFGIDDKKGSKFIFINFFRNCSQGTCNKN